MRGSGCRRGAEPTSSVGDLFPIETKYGKIYKIWFYRGSRAMYATACTPEIAARIDAYFEFRMRFGEACKLYEKSDHKHEYHDGYGGNEEVIERFYRADEQHLDPEAPLVREDFDKTDPLVAKHPERIGYEAITEIIRSAAIAAGVRKVNKGEPFKRHKVMVTHGLRKLFKKRCRQAKVEAIILERLIGHGSGNPREGISKLMMTYDPEDWTEMLQEFEKAIPNLTITKDAVLQAELDKAKAQLRNVPTIEKIQAQQQKMIEQFEKRYERLSKTVRLMNNNNNKSDPTNNIAGVDALAEFEDERQEEIDAAFRAQSIPPEIDSKGRDVSLESNIDYSTEEEFREDGLL